MTDLHTKFKNLQDALNQRHIERMDEVNISLIALLTRYHVALIGPPGTAKSMLAQDLTKAITGATYFYNLMSKFTTPEEIFGPWNIPALKEGRYERILDGYMAEAEIVFLDEMFKANAAVQNAMLTAMNERNYKNGRKVFDIPLNTLFAASNELPEGEELWALYDRFQLRRIVDYIHEPSNFARMVKGDIDHVKIPTIERDELVAAQGAVTEITVPETILATLVTIRSELNMQGLVISDRRYRQSIPAMQASAWLLQNNAVSDSDFGILQHMFWTDPRDAKKVSRVVLEHTNPLDLKAQEIIDFTDEIAGELTAALLEAKSRGENPKRTLAKPGIEWFARCRKLGTDLKKLDATARRENRSPARIQQARARLLRVSREVVSNTIGIESVDIDLERDYT
jgi:MoxR-like ATPase